MMDLPFNVQCLAKVRYESISAIQLISLSNLDKIMERLPAKATIQLLSKDKDVKWKAIKDVKLSCRNKFDVEFYKVNKFGDTLVIPEGKGFEIVTADKSIIGRSMIGHPGWLLGIAASDVLDIGELLYVNPETRKSRHVSYKTYLSNKNKYWKIFPVAEINKFKLQILERLMWFDGDIDYYVTSRGIEIAYSYETELLIDNHVYYPLLFSNRLNASFLDKVSYIPYNLNWIMHLLYGKDKEIVSRLKYKRSYENFHIPSLTFKKANWKTRSKKLQIELEDNYKPVIINNNIPMVYTEVS